MQLKRVIMILLVVILTVSAATMAVSADTGATLEMAVEVTSSTAISVDPLVINAGDTVTVRVVIKQNPGINKLMTKLCFDADAFKPDVEIDEEGYIKDYKKGEVFKDGGASCYIHKGNEIVLRSGGDETTDTGVVLEMDFISLKDFDGKAEFYLNMSINDAGKDFDNLDEFNKFYSTTFKATKASVDAHTFEKGEYVEPTCTEVGYVPYTCTKCGEMFKGDIVKANGHTPVIDPAVDSTCVAPGKTEGSHCSVCNEVIVAQQDTPAGGHVWGEWEVTKEPTEKDKGAKKRTCTLCGEVEEGTIPELDHVHKYVGKVFEPTCTEEGYTLYECECGDIYKDDKVAATGHDESGAAANCVNAKICPNCNTVLEEKLDHSAKWEAHDKQEAGCVTEGWESYIYCPECDAYPKDKVTIPAIGSHKPGAEATCTAPQTCTVCQEELAPAKGHTEVKDEAVAPTCTEAGKTEGSHCSVCNEVITAQEAVPATGHTPVTDAAVEPTYSETGLTEGSHCSVCDEVLTAQQTVDKKSTAPIWIACIVAVVVLAGAGVGIFFVVKNKGKK